MALKALGAIPRKKFSFLEESKDRRFVTKWVCCGRSWIDNPANAGNQVQNYGVLLQCARDFHEEKRVDDAVDLLDGLDKLQDPRTGLWGKPLRHTHLSV